MAYVALSRAVSLEGLRLRGYNVSAIRAHPDVERFYTSLQRRLSAGSPSRASASSIGFSKSVASSHSVEADSEKEDHDEAEASFGSIDWQAVDLRQIDQQAAAAIKSQVVKAEPQLQTKSQIQSEPENMESRKQDASDKNQTAVAVAPSRIWRGKLHISTAGTYTFASYGHPFSLIIGSGELLNNVDITRAKVLLLPGDCSLRIADGGATGESVPQELAWTPVPGGEDPGQSERMVTLWRRGGYWAVDGECAPPLIEVD